MSKDKTQQYFPLKNRKYLKVWQLKEQFTQTMYFVAHKTFLERHSKTVLLRKWSKHFHTACPSLQNSPELIWKDVIFTLGWTRTSTSDVSAAAVKISALKKVWITSFPIGLGSLGAFSSCLFFNILKFRSYLSCFRFFEEVFIFGWTVPLSPVLCECVYLIVEDDHDEHAEQHRLHQEDDVVSAERRSGWQFNNSQFVSETQQLSRIVFARDSHDQMLAGRLLSFFLRFAVSLVPDPPHPCRHHQHQGVQAGHTCTHTHTHTHSNTTTPALTWIDMKRKMKSRWGSECVMWCCCCCSPV